MKSSERIKKPRAELILGNFAISKANSHVTLEPKDHKGTAARNAYLLGPKGKADAGSE